MPYSSSPAYYWRDIYTILFDPLPFNAHGTGQLVAALENSVIVVLILISLRNLRMTVRASFARPYVMMCTIYCILFIYAFAALGNLGLIARERTLLFPFFLVLLCIPRTPRHRTNGYPWELRRKARNRQRRMLARGGVPVPPRPGRPPVPVTTGGRAVPSEVGAAPADPPVGGRPEG